MISFEVTSFKLLIDGECVRKSNIIISKISNKREEKFSLPVDWGDGRRVLVVNTVFWDQFLLTSIRRSMLVEILDNAKLSWIV